MAHDHDHSGHSHSHAPPTNNAAFAIGVVLNLGFVVAEVFLRTGGALAGTDLRCGTQPERCFLPAPRLGSDASDEIGADEKADVWVAAVVDSRRVDQCHHSSGGGGRDHGRGDSKVCASGGSGGWNGDGSCRDWDRDQQISALLFMSGRKRDLNLKGAFLHMAGDAAVSAGVVIAAFAIKMTGWQWLDPAVSLAIGGVIVWGTWGLLRESINLSMDAVPAEIDPHAVESYLANLRGSNRGARSAYLGNEHDRSGADGSSGDGGTAAAAICSCTMSGMPYANDSASGTRRRKSSAEIASAIAGRRRFTWFDTRG